jgi:hypothetical protein
MARRNRTQEDDTKKGPRGLFEGRDGMRFAILVAASLVLAVVVFGGDLLMTGGSKPEEPESAIIVPDVPVPIVDRDLVKKAKDATPDQRYLPEGEIYEHLLVKARDIAPGSLQALGMEEQGYTVDEIRRNPDRYRGKPVWFEGEVERLEPDTFKIPGLTNVRTRGLLRTDKGEPVFFAVVGPVPSSLTQGSYARIEGFFFKLRDERFPVHIVKAPFLVGHDLRPSFKKWEPVTELDPEVMSEIRDDQPTDAAEIEQKPLYHLISYAMNRPREEGWKETYPDLTRDSWKEMMERANGGVPRGAPFRLHASLYRTRTVAAEANPLGVEHWTYVWVDHPDAGTIQVQLPGRLEGDWNINDYVVIYGHFFKRFYYETMPKAGARHFMWAPFFVADSMLHWKLRENPDDWSFRITMAGITVLLILLMTSLVIRDSRSDKQLREALVERRRKRRLKQPEQ